MLLGDSISEGLRIPRLEDRYQSRTQATLRAVSGAKSGAAWPFIPGYYNSSNFETDSRNFPLEIEGNVAKSTVVGMSARATRLVDSTAALTFTFYGTSALLHFENGGENGIARVTVNGTPSLVQIENLAEGVHRIDSLGTGEHRIRVERSEGTVFVGGLTTYNDDEDCGVRIVDGARSGMATAQIADRSTPRAEAYQRYMRVTGPYQLAVIALGTNDSAGSPP